MSVVESSELTIEEETILSEMEKAFDKKDGNFLVKLLSNPPSSLLLRVHATCMLENVGGEEAVPVLCKILRTDSSALTRHEAAFTLGQLGYPSAIGALLEAMERDPSPIVRHESAVALSSIGDVRAIPYLEKATHDSDEDVRNSAVIALKYLRFLQRKHDSRPSTRTAKTKIRL